MPTTFEFWTCDFLLELTPVVQTPSEHFEIRNLMPEVWHVLCGESFICGSCLNVSALVVSGLDEVHAALTIANRHRFINLHHRRSIQLLVQRVHRIGLNAQNNKGACKSVLSWTR